MRAAERRVFEVFGVQPGRLAQGPEEKCALMRPRSGHINHLMPSFQMGASRWGEVSRRSAYANLRRMASLFGRLSHDELTAPSTTTGPCAPRPLDGRGIDRFVFARGRGFNHALVANAGEEHDLGPLKSGGSPLLAPAWPWSKQYKFTHHPPPKARRTVSNQCACPLSRGLKVNTWSTRLRYFATKALYCAAILNHG